MDYKGKTKKYQFEKYSFILLMLVLILGLVYFQSFAFKGELSSDFVIGKLVLDYSDPSVSAMFFSNYLHDPNDSEHIIRNIIGFLLSAVLIWLLYFFLIPKINNELPQYFFSVNIVLFLLACPFAVSGVTLFVKRSGLISENLLYGLGFSGISYAFTGFMVFLLSFYLVCVSGDRIVSGGDGTITFQGFSIIALSLLCLVLSFIFVILLDTGSGKNPFAHYTGFSLGLIIPALVSLSLDTGNLLQKAVCIMVVSAILAVASCAWIFI